MRPHRLVPLAGVLAAAFALTACTGYDSPTRAADTGNKPAIETRESATSDPGTLASAGKAAASAGKAQVLTVSTIDGFSPIVTNAKGRTIYRFDQDSAKPPTTTCTGPCAETWQPVLAGPDGVQVTGGLDFNLVGSIERPEGRQLTLKGWPLYYYKDDLTLGQTAGQGRNGTWFAIAPTGAKATTTGSESQSSGGDTSGGYNY